MASLADITSRVNTLVGSHDHITTAELESLVQTRYEVLYEQLRWSRSLRDFTISLVAQVASGSGDTVDVTNGSATVDTTTSGGTPFVAAQQGRQIQIGDEPQYFFILSVDSSSQITLGDGEGNAVVWPRATATEQSWRIFQTIYSLPADAQDVITLNHDVPIDEADGGRSWMDEIDPHRETTGDTPTRWAYAGVDSNNNRELEVWPVPTAAMLLRGQYARLAPTLSSASTIDISVPLLVYASAADAAGMLFAKTGDQSWQTLQVTYIRMANEARQTIQWRDKDRHSPPRSLRQDTRRSRLLGGDFATDHDVELL